jgi:hypothetical protein
VRQRGKEAYKLQRTNKNYNDYNGLESGKQVVGPMSAQTLVGWRLGECGDKFNGVCVRKLKLKRLISSFTEGILIFFIFMYAAKWNNS